MARFPLVAFVLSAALVASASSARLSSADDLLSTTCSVALDTFSRCSDTFPADQQTPAACCAAHAALTNFNCYCDPAFKHQAQGLMTAAMRQAVMQCPGQAHISKPITCNAQNEQVTSWSGIEQLPTDQAHILHDLTTFDGESTQVVREITGLSERLQQLSAEEANTLVGLTVEVDPVGSDEVMETEFTYSRPTAMDRVADLTAEVDFEVGPDVTRSEIEQILQGVTEWVSGMLDDNSDAAGHVAAVQQNKELSSITAHVADVISQMVSSLAGPNQDMDVEITYEFDLAAPEYGERRDDLAVMRDSMTSASLEGDMLMADEDHVHHMGPHEGHVHHMGPHEGHVHHMGHHHIGHRCLVQKTYMWLCHHKGIIQLALAVELTLCAVFGIVHLAWCFLAPEQPEEEDVESDLRAPLIEHASAYQAEGQTTISPLWAHVMGPQPVYSRV